jgi:hypothetical protein
MVTFLSSATGRPSLQVATSVRPCEAMTMSASFRRIFLRADINYPQDVFLGLGSSRYPVSAISRSVRKQDLIAASTVKKLHFSGTE